jgi:pimeloyl-ACP methyl ester carboxylesterase
MSANPFIPERITLRELDLNLPDGRGLHAYDTGTDADAERLTVFWHHGTPNIGAPPEPLLPTSKRLGIRWVSYDRPAYGSSTRRLGRDVASAAADTAAVADALALNRFAVMGHSGGAPHALACAALLPERVIAVVAGAGLAPYLAEGLDWFAGMAPAGEAALRAALRGREAKEAHEAAATGNGDIGFIQADFEALEGEWSWFGRIVNAALANGPAGLVDDDLAYVAPWGFEPASVTAPTLLLHGGSDRMVPSSHSAWLARRIPTAELWLRPDDGHVSVLRHAPDALEWLGAWAG